MDWISNPIVIGLAIGVPSFILGILGYRQSKKASKKAADSEDISQIIAGLNSLVTNLQADNASLREQLEKLSVEVDKLKKLLLKREKKQRK